MKHVKDDTGIQILGGVEVRVGDPNLSVDEIAEKINASSLESEKRSLGQQVIAFLWNILFLLRIPFLCFLTNQNEIALFSSNGKVKAKGTGWHILLSPFDWRIRNISVSSKNFKYTHEYGLSIVNIPSGSVHLAMEGSQYILLKSGWHVYNNPKFRLLEDTINLSSDFKNHKIFSDNNLQLIEVPLGYNTIVSEFSAQDQDSKTDYKVLTPGRYLLSRGNSEVNSTLPSSIFSTKLDVNDILTTDNVDLNIKDVCVYATVDISVFLKKVENSKSINLPFIQNLIEQHVRSKLRTQIAHISYNHIVGYAEEEKSDETDEINTRAAPQGVSGKLGDNLAKALNQKGSILRNYGVSIDNITIAKIHCKYPEYENKLAKARQEQILAKAEQETQKIKQQTLLSQAKTQATIRGMQGKAEKQYRINTTVEPLNSLKSESLKMVYMQAEAMKSMLPKQVQSVSLGANVVSGLLSAPKASNQ